MLQFDTHTGRPYSRLNTVTGTKAVHQGYPSRLYVGHNELQWGHSWLKDQEYREYRERYDHPLWKRLREQIDANAVGHGGMDFVMIYRNQSEHTRYSGGLLTLLRVKGTL